MESLSSLTSLDFSFNNIQTIAGNLFEKLINLQKLNLSRNKLSELTKWISNLVRVKVLDLSQNEISFINFDQLSNLNSLKERLNDNITGNFPAPLNSFRSLNYLSLQGNNMKIFHFVSFPYLKFMDILDNEIESIDFQ